MTHFCLVLDQTQNCPNDQPFAIAEGFYCCSHFHHLTDLTPMHFNSTVDECNDEDPLYCPGIPDGTCRKREPGGNQTKPY